MDYKKLFEIGEQLEDYLQKQNLYCEFYATDPDENYIVFLIEWGDWKHEHARFDYLTREYFKNKYRIFISQEVTEDDGSDCYSAKHYIIFLGEENE